MEVWLHTLLRDVHYTLLLGLFGWTAFPRIGLRGVERPPQARTATALAWAAPLITIALMLVSIAEMMGQPLAEVESSVIKAMLLETSIGWAFGIRLLALIIGALLIAKRPSIAALFYALALITLPWSGHAAASEGGLGLFHKLNDAVHLLAAGFWFGAICWFTSLAAKAHKGSVPAMPLLLAMHNFAPLGIMLVGIVTLTGIINAQLIFGLSESLTVLATPYGALLAAKVLLVGLMLVCASRHASAVRKGFLAKKTKPDEDAPSRILAATRKSLAIELALAIGVIALVAALGLLSPMPEIG